MKHQWMCTSRFKMQDIESMLYIQRYVKSYKSYWFIRFKIEITHILHRTRYLSRFLRKRPVIDKKLTHFLYYLVSVYQRCDIFGLSVNHGTFEIKSWTPGRSLSLSFNSLFLNLNKFCKFFRFSLNRSSDNEGLSRGNV